MITLSAVLTILAIILVLWILFKIYESVRPAIEKVIHPPWPNVIYWVLILMVTIYFLGYLGIVQPIIK